MVIELALDMNLASVKISIAVNNFPCAQFIQILYGTDEQHLAFFRFGGPRRGCVLLSYPVVFIEIRMGCNLANPDRKRQSKEVF